MPSSHPSQHSSYSLPPLIQNSVQLPPIKCLDLPPPNQGGAGANAAGRAERSRARHETLSRGRASAPSAPIPLSQHTPSTPPPHDLPPKRQYTPPPKPDASYAQPQLTPSPQQPPGSVSTHPGVNAAASCSESSAEVRSKRSCTQQGVNTSPVRSRHVSLGSPMKGVNN